jgi:hypothetical protein
MISLHVMRKSKDSMEVACVSIASSMDPPPFAKDIGWQCNLASRNENLL